MADPKIEQKTTADGQKVSVTAVDFEPEAEPWSRYRLADGTIVKMKTVVSAIYRIVDDSGKPMTMPNGEPGVLVTSTNLLTAKEP